MQSSTVSSAKPIADRQSSIISIRQLFLQHVAQTSPTPVGIEPVRAEGVYIYTADGRRYMDLIAGVSVSNVGHCHPHVVAAVKEQAEKYMHLMVYGEYIQSPQVLCAQALAEVLPAPLNCIYFVNSGSEANEGALKLAKRYTGRTEIIAMQNAYHGSTHGSLSVIGGEEFRRSFRPLLPDVRHIRYNVLDNLQQITTRTACIIIEPLQGEGGACTPQAGYLQAVRKRCNEVGALLIFDEVQTGFGRTGAWFAAQQYGVTPDIMTLAKGMGGGMPIGAFVSSPEIMNTLQSNPILGHITTFGGHPVSCAAALASLNVLRDENLITQVPAKSALFKKLLVHPKIKEVRGDGLLLAVELGSFELVQQTIAAMLQNGLLTDWFLFCDTAFRIAPPLVISEEEIKEACEIILKVLG